MIFIAYLLTLVLVPTLTIAGALITFPLLLLAGKGSPRLVSIFQGVTTGIVASWGCQAIFHLCGVKFDNTPLWLMGFLFLLNDWQRVRRAGSSLPEIGSTEMEELSLDNNKLDHKSRTATMEFGNMFGTPLGFLIWAIWFT